MIQKEPKGTPPVPMKLIGDLVAATADSAPPPFACPSILVTMTCPTCRAAKYTPAHTSDAELRLHSLFNRPPKR